MNTIMDSKLTKTVMPTVINDDLLRKCATLNYCQGPETEKIVQLDGLEFDVVETLSLDFKNVLRITNLWDFTSLQFLHLSHNLIEKIEGLDALSNLLHLDLSFNNIEQISGLDNLKKLTDLCLTGNKIRKLENLESLQQLQLFSVRDNQIEGIENIQYLRPFCNLQSVGFAGNPVAVIEDYHMKVIIYIPTLKYLDYRLISVEERLAAFDKYSDIVKRMQEYEKESKDKELAEAMEMELDAYYKESGIMDLTTSQFLSDVISCHPASQNLLRSTDFTEVFDEFSNCFYAIGKTWVKDTVNMREYFIDQCSLLYSYIEKCVVQNVHQSCDYCFKFAEYKERVLMSCNLWNDDSQQQAKQKVFSDLMTQLKTLWKLLMSEEMQLTEHIQKMIDVFKDELSVQEDGYRCRVDDYVQQLLHLTSGFLAQVLKHYSDYFKQLRSQDAIDSEGPEDYMRASTIEGILNNGNEAYSSAIRKRGELVISRYSVQIVEACNDVIQAELERHRLKVLETNRYCDIARDDTLDALAFSSSEDTEI